MSGVPSPRVRNPKPRSRLNHLTCALSRPLVGVIVTWVRGGGICAGCTAVESSMERTRNACRPRGRPNAAAQSRRFLRALRILAVMKISFGYERKRLKCIKGGRAVYISITRGESVDDERR